MKSIWKYLIICILFFIITGGILIVVLIKKYPDKWMSISQKTIDIIQVKINDKSVGNDLYNQVLPSKGVIIPVNLGNLGPSLLREGAIDRDKLNALSAKNGTDDVLENLLKENRANIVINKNNAGAILTFFWALGLSNKNQILENGPMVQNGNTADFASTGGWTLSSNQAIDHYSKHQFIVLTSEQQKLVEEIAKNIYRPCCDNSTYFPDCNHGMAMLGFLELMASQGLSQETMYKEALALNSFWFPTQYLTIAEYFKEIGLDWNSVDSKIILGKGFSSSTGFDFVKSKTKKPPLVLSGGSCSL